MSKKRYEDAPKALETPAGQRPTAGWEGTPSAEETSPMTEETPTAEEPPPVEVTDLYAALRDGWEQRDDMWINRRSFNIPGGAVPQGVVRNTEEAYALEVQRRG